MQWKLLLSLPGDMETEGAGDDRDDDDDDDMTGGHKRGDLLPTLKQWLRAKFTRGERSDSAADASQVHYRREEKIMSFLK